MIDTPVENESKRKRGKTKMNHIHNTTTKRVITLNDVGQPVSCGGKNSVLEFSNFLGTTLRQFVSLTCASWHEVPDKELLWEYVQVNYICFKSCIVLLLVLQICMFLLLYFIKFCCRISLLFRKRLNLGFSRP